MLLRFGALHGKRIAGFEERALQALQRHDWPGNVRELENLVERGVILASQGGMIEVAHLFPNQPEAVQTSVDAHGQLARLLALRRDVICGKLAPGERLRVEHLKNQYEVGAGTLREALSLLVSDALVTSEGQRGFRVAPISLADLEDVTNTRVMLETEALRQSIRHGDARWETALQHSYELLSHTKVDLAESGSALWERRNKALHEALIAALEAHIRLTHDIVKRQASKPV